MTGMEGGSWQNTGPTDKWRKKRGAREQGQCVPLPRRFRDALLGWYMLVDGLWRRMEDSGGGRLPMASPRIKYDHHHSLTLRRGAGGIDHNHRMFHDDAIDRPCVERVDFFTTSTGRRLHTPNIQYHSLEWIPVYGYSRSEGG